MPHLLVVEDDDDVAFAVQRLTAHTGYTTERARSLNDAQGMVTAGDFDGVLLDLGLPDGDALSLTTALRTRRLPFIVISARQAVDVAVTAMKAGAADYLTKPYSKEALASALDRIVPAAPSQKRASCDGGSEKWLRATEMITVAARAKRASVLIRGETGTGKEVVARRLHAESDRANFPFVAVNAACLAVNLAESELFGHEPGAFTDAKTTRRGLFELAHHGTLFLDEVGELPLAVQAKLLRVFETQCFRRVGGEREIKVDVRVIAATHRPLDGASFRQDLLQRLTVFEITLPPLRERGDDVLTLATLLTEAVAQEMGQRRPRLSDATLIMLKRHAWPGNVRELRNALERAMLTAGDALVLEPEHFSLRVIAREPSVLNDAITGHVAQAVAEHGGNISATARALGISRNRVKRHLKHPPAAGSV